MDAEKEIIEMADRIGQFYNYQITQSDTCELAKFLHNAGCRKQSDTIKEFAEALKKVYMARYEKLYSYYEKQIKSKECLNIGIMHDPIAISVSHSLNEIKRLFGEIEEMAAQYGVEEDK